MSGLENLLEQAWQVRQERFPPVLGLDSPQGTRSISLTGDRCALHCAHCNGHYLQPMLNIAELGPEEPRLRGAHSLLISGGCDAQGRVPLRPHLERVRALRPGRRLNWHVGLIDEQDLPAIVDLADVVSFDLVGDDDTIREVYGLGHTVEDYRATYRRLRAHVPVIPHITIGLRGGQLSGETTALRILQEEGAEAIVFLVLIPTPNTRYANCQPPLVEEVARLLAQARLDFPDTPLLLGCMRPAGRFRRRLDPLAVRAGINRIVKPDPAAIELAQSLGLRLEHTSECCALARPYTYPRRLRLSAGTETVLGLRQRPMDAAPTTAYLMLEGDGCAMDCAFCAQARHSHSRSDALSRIIWPEYDSTEVLDRLAQADSLQRICFQVTVHEKALEEVMGLARALRQRSDLPISVAIRPAHIEDLAQLLGAGVDQVGLGLDAACERVYRQIKGPQWSRIMALIEGACRRFPGHIRVHLIVGLDETERELCETMQKIYDWGGAVGLFAFTPVRGTRLQDRPQPPLDVYRRMQTARYLMQHKLARSEGFRYDRQGRLLDLGRPDWATLLADGEAFRTSGCPGCNRPFYNERPGGTMYNYPRPLRGQEAAQALQDMWAGLKEEC